MPEGLANPIEKPCPVIETAHRLEALPVADHRRAGQHHDAAHDRKGGNGLVAIVRSQLVQADGRKAHQPLAGQRRKAAGRNIPIAPPRRLEVMEPDGQRAPLPDHAQNHDEADKLRDGRRHAGSADAQVETEDEDGIEDDVEHGARHDANHREHRIALVTHLVVEREGAHDERRADQDEAEIVAGIRHDGVRGAQQRQDGPHGQETGPGEDDAGQDGRAQSDGGHFLGVDGLTPSQRPGDVIARSLSEKDGHGLDQHHIGVHDAHGSHRLRVDLPDEERVGQIVNARNEHADDRRNRHLGDEFPDRQRRHPHVFLVRCHRARFQLSFHSYKNKKNDALLHDSDDISNARPRSGRG